MTLMTSLPPSAAFLVYRIFYTSHKFTEDAPYVYILHFRHASRKPMTRAEAREIDKDA